MLDIRLLRDNPDSVKQRLANRGGDHASLVDQVLEIDTQRRSAETERQKLQGDRNRISKEIGMAKKNGQDTSAIEAEVRKINERIDEIGREADVSDTKQRDLLLSIPNLPHEACPVGHSAEENPEVRVWGSKPEFAFEPKDHTHVAGALGMIDFEAGVKITGSAFVVYKGAGARLERALEPLVLRVADGHAPPVALTLLRSVFVTGRNVDGPDKAPYDPWVAHERTREHARNFVFNRKQQVEWLAQHMDRRPQGGRQSRRRNWRSRRCFAAGPRWARHGPGRRG